MDAPGNLMAFREMIDACFALSSWSYDREYHTLFCNCESEYLFTTLFLTVERKSVLQRHMETSSMPLFIGDPMGLVWIAAFERSESGIARMHVIGPAYPTEVSRQTLEQSIQPYRLTAETIGGLVNCLRQVPVAPTTSLFQLTILLHFCVTGETIRYSDIVSDRAVQRSRERETDKHTGAWSAEQTLLQMVREGNLNYQHALDHASRVSFGVRINTGNPLRQAQNSVLSFVTLCTRAAIEGGLSPEIAYTLNDLYCQGVEDAKVFGDLVALSHTMYDDLIRRVHRCRADQSISKPIQSCRDYIELHIEEKLSVQELAAWIGYTDYYLTRKFKQETGMSISEYIRSAKIARAQELLLSTNLTVQEIGDRLRFCSRSYFAVTFLKVTGETPSAYRKQNYKR